MASMNDEEVTRRYFGGNRWESALRANHRTGAREYYVTAPCGCTLVSASGKDDWTGRWAEGCYRPSHAR